MCGCEHTSSCICRNRHGSDVVQLIGACCLKRVLVGSRVAVQRSMHASSTVIEDSMQVEKASKNVPCSSWAAAAAIKSSCSRPAQTMQAFWAHGLHSCKRRSWQGRFNRVNNLIIQHWALWCQGHKGLPGSLPP